MNIEEFLKTKNKKNIGLLQNVDIPLISQTCTSLDFKLVHVSGKKIQTESDFMEVMAASLEFPDYFGKNWDAFDECMRDYLIDLKSNSRKGSCLVITELEDFLTESQLDAKIFLLSINGLEDEREWGVPLRVILDCNLSTIRNLSFFKLPYNYDTYLSYRVIDE